MTCVLTAFVNVSKGKQTQVSPVFQIIAFDELRTDFKNPIDQSNPTRAVRILLLHCFQGWSSPYVHTEIPSLLAPSTTLNDLQVKNKRRVSSWNMTPYLSVSIENLRNRCVILEPFKFLNSFIKVKDMGSTWKIVPANLSGCNSSDIRLKHSFVWKLKQSTDKDGSSLNLSMKDIDANEANAYRKESIMK